MRSNMKKKKQLSRKIRFVIGNTYQNQEACSSDMKKCCKKCVECNFASTWINEDDCLLLKPTKQEIYVCEKFEGKTFVHLSNFKCIVLSPRVLHGFLQDGLSLPPIGTQLFSVAMKDCIVAFGDISLENKQRLKKMIVHMNGTFPGRAMPTVTHYVADNISTTKYQSCVAKGVSVMSVRWVEQVWVASQHSMVVATSDRFKQCTLSPHLVAGAVKQEGSNNEAQAVECDGEITEPSSEQEDTSVVLGHKCDVCQKHFATKQYLRVHSVEAHAAQLGHECGICGKVMASDARLQYHIQTHSKSHRCDVCAKTFAYRNLLRDHLLMHSGARHNCDVCDRSYSNPNDLNQHRKTHTVSYNCAICSQIFVYKNSLKKHMELHSGKLNHVCRVCAKSYTCAASLRKHQQVHHSDPAIHRCCICKQDFPLKDDLREHMKSHRLQAHQCDVCDKKYVNAGTLRKHKLSHSDPHCCEFCGKQFAFRDTLVNHLKAHANGKVFKCGLCEKSYGAQSYLRQHMKIHTSSFPCHLCDKVFAIKNSLKEHIQVHLGVKDHKCAVCGKEYVNGRKLRQHEKTHSESFKCFFCSKTCSRFPTLKVHFRTHSGLRSHQCTVCKDRAYTTARGLKLHMKTHVKPNPSAVSLPSQVK